METLDHYNVKQIPHSLGVFPSVWMSCILGDPSFAAVQQLSSCKLSYCVQKENQ